MTFNRWYCTRCRCADIEPVPRCCRHAAPVIAHGDLVYWSSARMNAKPARVLREIAAIRESPRRMIGILARHAFRVGRLFIYGQ